MWVLVAALGCVTGSPPVAPAAPVAPVAPVAPAAPIAPALTGVFEALARESCAPTTSCAGPFASVSTWVDSAGVPQRLVVSGDLQRCSHVMSVTYGPDGAELLRRSDRSASPEQLEALRAEHARVFEGLVQGLDDTCGRLFP